MNSNCFIIITPHLFRMSLDLLEQLSNLCGKAPSNFQLIRLIFEKEASPQNITKKLNTSKNIDRDNKNSIYLQSHRMKTLQTFSERFQTCSGITT